MTTLDDLVPPFHDYLLKVRCSNCHVEPGIACDAPRRQASQKAWMKILDDVGNVAARDAERGNVIKVTHKVRQRAAAKLHTHHMASAIEHLDVCDSSEDCRGCRKIRDAVNA